MPDNDEARNRYDRIEAKRERELDLSIEERELAIEERKAVGERRRILASRESATRHRMAMLTVLPHQEARPAADERNAAAQERIAAALEALVGKFRP